MNAINRAATSVFDVVLTPFEALGDGWALFLVSGVFGILCLLIFKQISWQKGIKATKDKIKGNMIAIRLYQDDLRIKVAKPFAPITLQEEVGANLKAVNLDLLLLKATVATRLGFGFRQGIMNGLLVEVGDEEDPTRTLTLAEVDDYSTLGPVLGMGANVTLARWLFGAGQFNMMVPLKDKEDAGDGFGERLLWDISGSAGLKLPALTSFLFASIDYTFRVQKDGFVEDDVQFDQTLLARLNVSLF